LIDGRFFRPLLFHDLLNKREKSNKSLLNGICFSIFWQIRIFVLSFSNMAVKIEKWVVAQKKHRLSDKHVEMARQLGLNPDKLGIIDNHKQETWKAPLPQFIENIYFKRFKREEPLVVRSLKDVIADDKAKKEKKKKEKAKHKGNNALEANDSGKTENPAKPLSLSAKLKLYSEKTKVRTKLESGDTPETILRKEAHIFDEAFDFYEKEQVMLSELGFILKKIHPSYKPRRYGCKTLGAIYEKLDKYKIEREEETGNYIVVRVDIDKGKN